MNASVVMPTTGGRPSVIKTVRSVTANATDQFDELLVVHNGSQSHSLKTAVEECSNRKFRVRYVHEPTIGLLAGRHRGVAESQSDILVFIDDDIEVQQSWAEAILDAFEDSSVALVGGPCLPAYESSPPDWLSQFWCDEEGVRFCGYLSLLDAGDSTREISPHYVWGLNFSIRRNVLLKLGGFHPDGVPWDLRRFRGDGETGLCKKLANIDIRAVFEPRASINHLVPANRLTIDYFQRRALMQGISDSYAAIREFGAPEVKENERPVWRRIGSKIRRRVLGTPIHSNRSNMRGMLVDAAKRGYAYHQSEVACDPQLLEWVMRKDYWDYSYPRSFDSAAKTNSR